MSDWGTREWDQKPDTRPGDNVDRAKMYMRLHKSYHRSAYCMDFDQVEWSYDENGVPYIVALIELTCVSPGRTLDDRYRKIIERRAGGRDAQIETYRAAARHLDAQLYYVAYDTV
ncbi:MAG: hypothetical protein KAI25_06280, partial [Hyphomicrobiaceae bacterium]|nr:hypothetical protein [Hyphomicrobiaceae bacterium]